MPNERELEDARARLTTALYMLLEPTPERVAAALLHASLVVARLGAERPLALLRAALERNAR